MEREDAPDIILELLDRGGIVLALATSARKRQRVAALEAGVHEFLTTSPIDVGQMEARLRLLAHGSSLPTDFALDREQQKVIVNGTSHEVSMREATLIETLLEARGGFVTHKELLSRAWDDNADDRQYLRVAINRLRARIEPEPDLPRYLLSEPAVGYRIGTGAPNRPDGTAHGHM